MRLARVHDGKLAGLAVTGAEGAKAIFGDETLSDLDALVVAGRHALAKAAARVAADGVAINVDTITWLPPLVRPSKIICLGINYADHAAEGGFEAPSFPVLFGRFPSSLIGHNAPIIRPKVSTMLDYEGEMVAVIGTRGKNIAKADALGHVAGYSIFNDGSIRDYQFKTPQWTAGKNFDGTGAFGPWFLTPDELPPGAAGLHIETRLNGQVMQSASTSDMIFDVATTIELLSTFLTLEAGDVLVMGTPSGIGFARDPKVFMKHGDICEIEIEGIGILRNPIVDE